VLSPPFDGALYATRYALGRHLTDFTFRRFTGFGRALFLRTHAFLPHTCYCATRLALATFSCTATPLSYLFGTPRQFFIPSLLTRGVFLFVRRSLHGVGPLLRSLLAYVRALPFRIPHLGEVLFSGLHASPENQSQACACAWPAP